MSLSARRWIVLVIVVALALLLDQATKTWVINNLVYGQSIQPIPALAPFFQLTYTQNRGAAFGFLSQLGDIFLVIAVAVVAAMLFFYPRIPAGAWGTRIAFGMVIAGALGNALDRIQYGFVVDFIHYQIPGVISNVSNLADHAIVIGMITLLIQTWRSDAEKKRADAISTDIPAS